MTPETLRALAKELCEAREGSRELDAHIFCAVKWPMFKPQKNFFYKEQEVWGVFVSNQPKPGMTFHDAPPYTTSLDASLPGEEVWHVQRFKIEDVISWEARCSTQIAVAHTEPLARRAAALLAMADEVER